MMNKRVPRPVFFVCSAINIEKTDVISKVIQALSQNEAASLFFEQTGVKATAIHGPFRPKKAQVIENTRSLKFTNEPPKQAFYNDWEVNAFFLREPEGHSYLIFIKRIDDKKQSPPNGTIIVPISDLRFS
jgi:hypothetical protein